MAAPPTIEIPGYQLLRALGEGGMATVFLAVQRSLDRKVAIKILRTHNDDDPERTERRFLREGRTLAKITHRNVCGIYDIAKVGDVAYIAMEFLDGGTLVDRQRSGISVGESIAIVVQVASALQEAHNQGIVHRDLKPANVMMRGGKVPVITDFGIARELSNNQTRITTENMIVGTPVYMSPEQVTGGDVDGRSDVYALGIMFYELLVGSPPFEGENPIQVCMQHLTSPVPKLPPELDELNPVLSKMLAKKAEERFASMSEFTHALRDVFVRSTQLRAKAELSPNQPWTEQLRQMGFSFDTLRDSELNAQLRQQQAQATANERPSAPTKKPAAERAGPIEAPTKSPIAASASSKMPLWVGLGVAAVLIIGFGLYALYKPSAGKVDRYALQGMAASFDAHLQAGELFEPVGANAAQTLADMREISAKNALTNERVQKFAAAVQARLAEQLVAGEIEAAQRLFDQAQDAGIYDDAAADQVLASIVDARRAVDNKAAIAAQVKKIEALLELPDRSSSVLAELDSLRQLTPKNSPVLVSVETKVSAKMVSRIEIALGNNDTDQAVQLLSDIAANLPNFPNFERYQSEIRARQAKLGAAAQEAKVRGLLTGAAISVEQIKLAASEIAALSQSNPELAALPALRTELLEKGNALALRVLSGEDGIKAAQAVVSALGEFKGDPLIRPARTAILAAKEAQQAVELTGYAVIDTAPYSKVLAISDSSGKAVAVPAPGVTPLRLALLEGRYRVELSNALGETKSVQISVTRKANSESPHVLYAEKSDDYLREAGY